MVPMSFCSHLNGSGREDGDHLRDDGDIINGPRDDN